MLKVAQATDIPDFLQENKDVPDFLKETPSAKAPHINTDFGAGGNQGTDAVKKMQEAIVKFGATLAANPVMSMQQTGTQERPGATMPDFLGGTDPFGRFLVDQYVNNAKVVGKQFVNVQMHEPERSGSAISNVNLKGVINTISYIGTPGHEHQADGIWQTRTNNALKQIFAVGKSLMQFAKDMKFNIKGFSENELNKLGELIPASYTDLKNASQKAEEITPIINQLTALYKTFESTVLEHPEVKTLINQDKPFMEHAQLSQTDLSQEDKTFYETNKDANIPGANVNGKPVRLMDIVSIVAFRKFLQEANVDISKLSEVQKYVNEVKKTLGGTDFGAGF